MDIITEGLCKTLEAHRKLNDSIFNEKQLRDYEQLRSEKDLEFLDIDELIDRYYIEREEEFENRDYILDRSEALFYYNKDIIFEWC